MNAWLASAITAGALSSRVRRGVRKVVVYGLAGVLSAEDAVVSAARGVTHEAEEVAHAASSEAQSVVRDARAVRHPEPEKPAHKRQKAEVVEAHS